MSVLPGRLVTRFAVISLVAFVAIGGVLGVLFSRQAREKQEEAARAHAGIITDSILRYELTPRDLRSPVTPDSPRYRALLRFVRGRILQQPVVRLKIWRPDGTIVFSDDARLVGKRFPKDDDLRSALEGRAASSVADLEEPENVDERSLARKLLSSYLPVYLDAGRQGRPNGAVEVYTDYAGIQAQINGVLRTLAVTGSVGLAALYLLMLPIVIRVSRTLSKQNQRLGEQTNRLIEHLQREKATVTQLTELNEMKGNFVAVASHELRSPLTSIIGYIKTLKRPEFKDNAAAQSEFLDAAERQADRLLQLVENLLAASRLEEQERRLSLAPLAFDSVALEVVDALGGKRVRVKLAIAPNLPNITSDRQWLELVVANLVNNAIKFSPDDATCELGAKRDRSSLVIWVRDEGIGIPAEQQGRIFDRFYQVDSSATRRFGGVGLGLSLVKELVTSLGGDIGVESHAGKGSTFTLTLPLVHPDAVIDPAHLEPEPVMEAVEARTQIAPPVIVATRPY
jgi:signal transduction histidine kinase